MRKVYLSFYLLLFTSYLAIGQTWSAVGTQTYAPGNATFLGIYNGQLFAGVSNLVACSPRATVLEWSGSSWVTTSGLAGASANTSIIYNNNLIIGGALSTPIQNVAEWGDTAWNAMGGGTLGTNALVEYNGNLYSGGLSDFEVWAGHGWTVADKGAINSVYAFAVYNGSLYAGGNFAQASGVANNIAMRGDTSWETVGSGINGSIYALTTYNGELYAAGFFDSAGGKYASNIAVWNDTNWAPVGGGVNFIVLTMTVFNGQLIVGGEFDSAGGKPANYIAAWNGSAWSALGNGVNNNVTCLAAYDSVLYVGGDFTSTGGIAAHNIAQWTPNPAGINEVIGNSEKVKVYPNPSDGLFSLAFSHPELISGSHITVYNTLGEKVFLNSFSTPCFTLDLSGYPSGIYFYRITTQDGKSIANGKLVLKK